MAHWTGNLLIEENLHKQATQDHRQAWVFNQI